MYYPNKLTFLKYPLALIITISTLTCELPTNPATVPTEILPLRVGNIWRYEKISQSRRDTVVIKSYDTMTVIAEDTLFGQSIFIFDHFIVPFYFTSKIAFSNQSNGLYLISWSSLDANPPLPPQIDQLLKYPTIVGDTLRFDGLIIRTISTNESITTAAGNFQCVQYAVYQDTLKILESWLSPGSGIIQTQYIEGNWVRHYSLVSFNVLPTSFISQ